MKLPADLKALDATFQDVFNTILVAKPWPEGEAFTRAEQPKALAKLLIRVYHQELRTARIGYLFRERITKKLGVATRAGGKLEFLTDFDFVIEFNYEEWLTLTPEQRIALVDHELCHCTEDSEKGSWASREHDVEEFGAIVRRWGLWRPSLSDFGRDVRRAMDQGELFAPPAPEPEAPEPAAGDGWVGEMTRELDAQPQPAES